MCNAQDGTHTLSHVGARTTAPPRLCFRALACPVVSPLQSVLDIILGNPRPFWSRCLVRSSRWGRPPAVETRMAHRYSLLMSSDRGSSLSAASELGKLQFCREYEEQTGRQHTIRTQYLQEGWPRRGDRLSTNGAVASCLNLCMEGQQSAAG